MPDASSREKRRERKPKGDSSAGGAETRRSPAILLVFLSLVVVGVTLFAHWPALSAQALAFDDDEYLTDNMLVQRPSWASAGRFLSEVLQPSTVRGYYQPLTMISLMLDYAVAGSPDNLRPFHRTSLVLHVANTVLVIVLLYMLFPLTRRLPAYREGPRNAASPPAANAACQGFGQPWVAAMVGLLFGVHPMTVETIPWVGERKTLLAAFFALWSLVVYVRYTQRPSWKRAAACLGLYVLALLAKPTSTPLPLVMLLLDFWPLRRLTLDAPGELRSRAEGLTRRVTGVSRVNWRAVVEKLPLLAVAVAFSAITAVSQARSGAVALPTQYPAARIPLTLCHNIIFYLSHVVWPAGLSAHYPIPQPLSLSDPVIWAGVIGTCILIPALAVSLRWTRAWATGWLIFFVAIFPTMGVLGFTIAMASDKYAYLPAVGLLLVAAWLLARIWSGGTGTRHVVRQVGVAAAVAVVAGLLVTGTRRYSSQWRTTESLYDYMIPLAPRAALLYNNRAVAYYIKGDYDRVIQDCNKAIELKPDYADAYHNRGNAYGAKGDYDREVRDCTRAIEIRPDSPGPYNSRANAYGAKGDHAQAIRDCDKAIELKPDRADGYNHRGTAYYVKGDYAQAIRDYTTAIEHNPDHVDACNNRGVAYSRTGDYDRAIQDFTQAIRLKPGEADVYSNRGNAYSMKGDRREAIRDYTRAVELRPNDVAARHNRAAAYYDLKEYDKAWADVRQCRKLGATPSPDLVRKLTEATGKSE